MGIMKKIDWISRPVAVIVLAVIGMIQGPQATWAAEMMAAARSSIRAAEARSHVLALADDALEGREGGSRGGRAAGSYIVSHLEKLSLEPAGDAGGYYQPVGSLRNILALSRGGDPSVAGELVVVGAHYDHVGYGNAGNSYGPFGFVHNGADDNASGVAGLIELAEAIEHLPHRPRRPILFAFWDGEEKGLLGSSHFVRVPSAAVAGMKPVFSVNLDMIGRLRGDRLVVYGSRTAEGLRSSIVQANNSAGVKPLEVFFDWAIDEDSDHYPFIVAKVPTVMFHTGLHDQYHRPSDDVQFVNFEGIEPVTRVALEFVVAIANGPGAARSFRAQCRSESNATKRSIEAPAGDLAQARPPSRPGVRDGEVGPRNEPARPRWGLGTRSDPGEPCSPVIVRVAAGSAAAAAGVILGDRVTAVDGVPLESQADMVARLAAAAARVTLDLDRKGRLIRIEMHAPESGE